MNLIFIVVANDEGLVLAEVGTPPGIDYAPYSLNLLTASQHVMDASELGDSVCTALVLNGGRMLILKDANVGGQEVYLSILCSKVPSGMQSLLKRILDVVSHALIGH